MNDKKDMTNDEKINTYIELEKRKKKLQSELNKVKKKLNKLEGDLLEYFEETGTSSINRNGITLYLHSQLWANPINGDYERACKALKDAGLDDYVRERFNTHQVSAFVREIKEQGEDLPEQLEENLNIHERFSLRSRKK